MTRAFPVLNQQDGRPGEWLGMPRSVPWEFVETFRAAALRNHNQTLERLAERGGLDPREMYAAAHGARLCPVPLRDAIAWLASAVEGARL